MRRIRADRYARSGGSPPITGDMRARPNKRAGLPALPWIIQWLSLCKDSIRMKYVAGAIYCVILDSLIWGGIGYAVFWLNRSGWWFAFAVLASSCVGVPEGVRSASVTKASTSIKETNHE